MAHRAIQLMGGAATTVVLAACYGGPDLKDDSGSSPSSGTLVTGTAGATAAGSPDGFSSGVVWTDDGLIPTDTDNDGVNDTNCDGDGVDVTLMDPLGRTDWSFGMAEDGSYGWTGEDCFSGSAGVTVCHPFTAPTLHLDQVCTPGEVVPGQTTLLNAAMDPFLTYFLEDSAGNCFVFGTDIAYYAALGCTEML